MNILIADDTASDRIVLKSYLKQLGHDVLDVSDGRQAIETFSTHQTQLDLVILDVLMPNLDGYDTAKKIRTMEGDEWLPIIFLSAQTEADDLSEGIHAGGDDYLFKPVDKIILTAKMHAMQRISLMRRKLSEMNKRLARMVNLDGLTGAANRRYLDEYLEREWLRAHRNQSPLSICMVDVDLFKSFNDQFGHLAGDECLKSIVSTIDAIPRRPGDIVARYGGEEFCCVLPDTGIDDAARLAEAMRKEVEERVIGYQITNTDRIVTVSIGVATVIPDKDSSIQHLISKADKALYQAKEFGRNQIRVAG